MNSENTATDDLFLRNISVRDAIENLFIMFMERYQALDLAEIGMRSSFPLYLFYSLADIEQSLFC